MLDKDLNVPASHSGHDFFVLWKDAGPDIPIRIAAKAKYANLK